MPVPVEAFFQHNAWANLRLIEVCEGLTPEQLDTPPSAAYGTIRDTLVHLVAAEQRYVRRLEGDPGTLSIVEGDTPSFDELKRASQAAGDVLAAMAKEGSEGWRIRGVTDGVRFDTEGTIFLLQVINHSTEHRTQILSMLSLLNAGPEGLDELIDGWAWGEVTGRLSTSRA